MKTALILCTYNRVDYLTECLDSLKKLKELPDLFIVVDDNSNDETRAVLNNIRIDTMQYHLYKQERKGIKDSLLKGFSIAFDRGADFAINLDSDAIVKPEFITRLKNLKKRFPDRIVSGFNCNHPVNPVLFSGDDYVERAHCNGINMGIDSVQFENIVKKSLNKPVGNWDFDSTHNKPFIIAKPSVVQHIGMVSSMGHNENPDVSCDYA